MFPFVGAPMFVSAGRRKRKWTIVFALDGSVATGDVIRVEAGHSSSGTRNEDVEGDEREESSFMPSKDEGMPSGNELGPGRNDEVASEAAILLSTSALVASTSTSMELSSSTWVTSGAKRQLRRSCSLVNRGNVRVTFGTDNNRSLVPSERYTDGLAVSSLECLLEHSGKWNFDTFLLNRLSNGHPVVAVGCKIFQTHQFHRVFQLDWTALMLCLRLIENGYRQNPYHNSVHAADVAQAMNCFLQESALATALDPLEKMACILAAFGHDLYHPGVNQKFLEGNDHFLCQLYNRISVLESFHWRCLVSIIKESSLCDSLSRQQWKKLVHLVEVLILATDMQRQQEYLNQFKEFLSSHICSNVMEENRNRLRLMQPYLERGVQPHTNQTDERLFVMQILIKCADISNPCRPWMISKEWSVRVADEFFNQGDEERRRRLPVTSFCDRYATSVAKIQSGFMEYVAQPLFADWDQYMRSPLSSFMLRNLRINCQNWNKALRDQVQQQEQQMSRHSSPARSLGSGLQPATVQAISAASSLEEMAELEMQKPDVLKRRASSSALPRSRSPRSSFLDQQRRVSLPVTVGGGGATLWTASVNRRMYEAVSTSDISSAPIRLLLSHSDVAEESDDEESVPQQEAIKEGEEEEEESENTGNEQGGKCCTGDGCGTPPTPMPSILVSPSTEEGWRMEKDMEKTPCNTESTSQQERRFSEPLVLTLGNLYSLSSKHWLPGQRTDESGLLPNLMLLQRCMPRRGSLPMTQKELEGAQANNAASLVPLNTRGYSQESVPESVTPLGRFVGVS